MGNPLTAADLTLPTWTGSAVAPSFIIKLTGTATVSGDVTADALFVEWLPF